MTPTDTVAKTLFLERRLDALLDQEISIYGTDENWKEDHASWLAMSDSEKNTWIQKANIWLDDLRNNSPVIYDYVINNCLLEV